jgi:hypothetical protein
MKVKDIFKTQNDWTQGSYARNKDNIDTGSRSPTATKFCLVGAVHLAYLKEGYSSESTAAIFLKIETYLIQNYRTRDITEWNDDPDRDFKEVKDMVNILDI